MKVLIWLIHHLGRIWSILGVIMIFFWWIAMDDLDTTVAIICVSVGALLAIGGFVYGAKTWDHNVAPIPLMFMSNLSIMNTKFGAALTWAIRFFLFPFGITFVAYLVYTIIEEFA
ncbi:MAG: hypothetical protein J6P74_04375 [Paludibacteraceae bacterium]|nr:hypothetical protein [Paludibacteraceae bacterium]